MKSVEKQTVNNQVRKRMKDLPGPCHYANTDIPFSHGKPGRISRSESPAGRRGYTFSKVGRGLWPETREKASLDAVNNEENDE